MHVRKAKKYTIAIALWQGLKSGRDRASGILRYFSRHPDFRVVFLNNSMARAHLANADALIGDETISRVNRRRLSAHFPQIAFEEIDARNRHIGYRSAVSVDNVEIAHAAAELLIKRGYTNFAYIGESDDVHIDRVRENAFVDQIAQNGFSCWRYTLPSQFDAMPIGTLTPLTDFIRSLPKPCGIMIYMDKLAQTVIDACNYLHMSIPGQIALVSVDNDVNICENLHPTLTSIMPDFELSGYLAAEMAHRQLLGEIPLCQRAIYGVKTIVERDSTQDLRGCGRLVSLAENYLRKNLGSKINIGTMAGELGVSRRLLELRFREVEGCSVLTRLTKLRIFKARESLANTDRPINEIARSCGYASYMPFRKAFIAETGLTPKVWRSRNAR